MGRLFWVHGKPTLPTDESPVLLCSHRSEVEPQDAVRAADNEFGILRGRGW
jgi:hypothetical protein